MEFRTYVVGFAVLISILSVLPGIDVEKHWKVNTTPVPIEESIRCSRVDVPGFSKIKRYAAVVLVPPPEIPETSFKRIQICLHNNSSLGLCQCEKDDWGSIQNGMWGVYIDAYEDKYVDVKFVECQRWSVPCHVTHLASLPLPSVVSGLWVSVCYSSSMAMGIFLAILILLFQKQKRRQTPVLEECRAQKLASRPQQLASTSTSPNDNLEKSALKAMGPEVEGDYEFGDLYEIHLDSQVYPWQDKYSPRKPKYLNRFNTGYCQKIYSHDNPPPRIVLGYMFNISYHDLVDKSIAPRYTIYEDGNSDDSCIISFHSGAPYEDIAFRIVKKEWEVTKSTFEGGILHLFFKVKRQRHLC